MLHVTRRDAIRQIGLTGLLAAFGGAATAQPGPDGGIGLSGHVHALGLDPRLFPEYDARGGRAFSVLTSLDLATGLPRQSLIPIAGGHVTCNLPDNRILCVAHHESKSVVVDRQHNLLAEIITDPEHVFGGHGLLQPDRNVILLPQKRKRALGIADLGSLLVYDARTFRLLDQVETGGIHPHELQPIPGTDELAVTHYGDIATEDPVFMHNVVDPKLSVLDARTLRPKRHYPQRGLKAMVTHMRVAEDGWAYLVLTQYIRLQGGDARKAYDTAVSLLERAIGRKMTFAMPQPALTERKLPVPLPMLAIHTQTGESKVINTGDCNHLRSQSVAYSRNAGVAVGVYAQSNTLVVVPSNGQPTAIRGESIGLRNMRGVTEIPGSTCVAVMGAYRNAVVFDLRRMTTVASYATINYLDTHLTYSS